MDVEKITGRIFRVLSRPIIRDDFGISHAGMYTFIMREDVLLLLDYAFSTDENVSIKKGELLRAIAENERFTLCGFRSKMDCICSSVYEEGIYTQLRKIY